MYAEGENMKKIKSTLFFALAIFCMALFGGCAIYPSVVINDWDFAPQQASGTEINLSLISGSEMEFNFTVKNYGEERNLLASAFDVLLSNGETSTSAISIYLDNHKSSLSFVKNESKNIKLHAVSTITISQSTSITIKYDGTAIVEYFVR